MSWNGVVSRDKYSREEIIMQTVKLEAESRGNSAELAAQVKSLGGKSKEERWAIVSVNITSSEG